MENKRFYKIVLFGQVFFALALLIFVVYQFQDRREVQVLVRAELCANAPVDLGVWGGQLSVRRNDLIQAQEELERNRERVLRNFTAKGILVSDIEFSTIQTNNDSNQFVLSQHISVSTRDLERLKKVISESGELLKFRIDFSADEPKYHITNFSAWLLEQLPFLIDNARKQAQILMDKGQEIKSIKRFNMVPLSSMKYLECAQLETKHDAQSISIFLEAEIEFLVR